MSLLNRIIDSLWSERTKESIKTNLIRRKTSTEARDILVIDTSDYKDWEKLQDWIEDLKWSELRKMLMKKIKQFEETLDIEIHEKIESVIFNAENNWRSLYLVKTYFRLARKRVLNFLLQNNYFETDKRAIYDWLINLYNYINKLWESWVDIEKYYAKLKNNIIHHLEILIKESLEVPSRKNVFILENFLSIAHKCSINIQKFNLQLEQILKEAEEYRLKELIEIFIEEPSERWFEEIFSHAKMLEWKWYDISKLNSEREKLIDMICVEDIYRAIDEMLRNPCQNTIDILNETVSKAEKRGIDIKEEKECINEAFLEAEKKLRELINLAYYDYINFWDIYYFELFKIKVRDANELWYYFEDFQNIIKTEEKKIEEENNS